MDVSLHETNLELSVNALTQLEDLIQEKKYGEIAQTLSVSEFIIRSCSEPHDIGRLSNKYLRPSSLILQSNV